MFVQSVPMGAVQPDEFKKEMRNRSPLLRLARPHQWTKNLLLLAPLIFSRHLFIFHDSAMVLLGVVGFCAMASFAYALNDIIDREADRLNPEKRDRPIASGAVSVATATRFASTSLSVSR